MKKRNSKRKSNLLRDPLASIRDPAIIPRDKLARRKKELENDLSGIRKQKATFLDIYVLDVLKELGHPDKVMMDLVEKNIAMMNIIEGQIEKEMWNTSRKDEETGEDIPTGLFNPILAELYRKYSVEVRSGLKDLSRIWESVAEKDVDERLMLAYQNVTIFVEFLNHEDPDMVLKWYKWKSEMNKDNGRTNASNILKQLNKN